MTPPVAATATKMRYVGFGSCNKADDARSPMTTQGAIVSPSAL
jgi:hypothetical protein